MSEKFLTLPSGATCTVRKFTVKEAMEWKGMPDPFLEPPEEGKELKIDPEKAMARGLVMAKTIMLSCVSKVTRQDGAKFELTERPWKECKELPDRSEENWEVFAESADGMLVSAEVFELSGIGKAAREAAPHFPERPQPGGSVPQNSQDVPQAAQ